MDQDEYIKALIPIVHKDMIGKPPECPAGPELESLFRSLLGAVAYTQLTQHQIACYVVALQRVASKLTIGEVRRLNVLTKRLQKKPLSITYQSMQHESKNEYLSAFSDAGFKKEETDGYALRGAVYIRHCKPMITNEGAKCSSVSGHLLHVESRSIKTVCRSTYAAELLAATATTDVLIPLTITMTEVVHGVLGAEELKRLREEGWRDSAPITTRLLIDAKSVFESLKATVFKAPSENSLAGHVLWLREMLEKKLLQYVTWSDTRDMLADGLTKGSVSREALEDSMIGMFSLHQAFEQCSRNRHKVTM